MASPARQPGWWSRNWKWAVPVGCLIPIMACAGFGVLIVTFTFGLMKSSEPYQEALARARASAEVTKAMGTPVEPGFYVSGEVKVNNDGSGKANLEIPISGPRGAGIIHVVGVRSGGQWNYTTLDVEVDQTSTRIDLLAGQ